MDKRKGFWAGYKKLGPINKFIIKFTVIVALLGTIYFAIQMKYGASKNLQKKAKEDRSLKHEEVVKNQKEEISKLSDIQDKVNIIVSSKIKVYLKITINEPVPREFNGTIAVSRDRCSLKTKSGTLLTFNTPPGSTIMVRKDRQYEFAFDAELLHEKNIYRQNRKEFIDATGIMIPLDHFIKIIRKKNPNAICTLAKTEVSFFVNNEKVKTKSIVGSEAIGSDFIKIIELN